MAISNRTRINEEIRSDRVRVVGTDGGQLGIMSGDAARRLAAEAGVDLVEISPTAIPPVVKIIDWGKYQYQKTKEQARAKKRAKTSELKQMKLGLKIGDNDLKIKVRKINEFLEDGDRVKLMIVLRGREMAHKELGHVLLDKVVSMIGDTAVLDGKPQFAGRSLSVGIRRK